MTLYAVNILWLVSTGIGLILAAIAAREAFLDVRALHSLKRNGDKRTIATGSLAANLLLFLGQSMFFVVAVPTLWGPYPKDPFSAVAALFIMGSWAMTGASAVALWANARVR